MTSIESHAREEELKGSSDRVFGLVFAAFIAILAFWPLLSGGTARIWLLVPAGLFLLLALLAPPALAPLNRLWMRFGLLLGKVVSPIALGIVFLLAVVPIGWLLRRSGKDPLRRTLDSAAGSYWIPRDPPGPDPKTMNRQF